MFPYSRLLIPALLLISGATAAETKSVSIKGMAYSPATVTISAGDTVTWTNNDDRDHTVQTTDGVINSGNLSPGKSWSYTFKSAGTYSYGCTYHPRMKGTITVK